MNRIAFVDDERNVLQGLKVMLHSMRASWQIDFVDDPEKALHLMEVNGPFEIIVSDIHMPRRNGTDFLAEVMERYPTTVRFVLSGNLDADALAQAGAVAHQIIAKPCNSHRLRSLLSRALGLQDRLPECTIRDTLLELGGIPTVPSLYWEMYNEIHATEPSVDRIAQTIAKDPGMSAKVLQIVNAGVGNDDRGISNVVQAVRLLGIENIKSIILMAGMFTSAEQEDLPSEFDLSALWEHGMTVGDYAKAIAESETDDQEAIDDSYTSGLLHDLGLLILANKLPMQFRELLTYSKEQEVSLFTAGKDLFRATHAEIGGFLLDLWGLPDAIVEAISYHSLPSSLPERMYQSFQKDGAFSPLTAVHVANCFCAVNELSDSDYVKPELDTVYLERLGVLENLESWWSACYRN